MDSSAILEKGDIVETAKDSAVDIVIGRDTDKAIKVKEKSRIEFQGVNPAKLNLTEGEILVALKKLEKRQTSIDARIVKARELGRTGMLKKLQAKWRRRSAIRVRRTSA